MKELLSSKTSKVLRPSPFKEGLKAGNPQFLQVNLPIGHHEALKDMIELLAGRGSLWFVRLPSLKAAFSEQPERGFYRLLNGMVDSLVKIIVQGRVLSVIILTHEEVNEGSVPHAVTRVLMPVFELLAYSRALSASERVNLSVTSF